MKATPLLDMLLIFLGASALGFGTQSLGVFIGTWCMALAFYKDDKWL